MRGGDYGAVRWGRGEGNSSSQISEQASFRGSVHPVISDLSFRHKQNARPIPNYFSLPL